MGAGYFLTEDLKPDPLVTAAASLSGLVFPGSNTTTASPAATFTFARLKPWTLTRAALTFFGQPTGQCMPSILRVADFVFSGAATDGLPPPLPFFSCAIVPTASRQVRARNAIIRRTSIASPFRESISPGQ